MQWKPYSVNEQIKITHLYSLFKGVRGKEYSFEGETHPFWECVYVVDGSICASADDKVYNMSAGELIFHKPLELHKLSVTCNKPATIFIFSFSAEGVILFGKDFLYCVSEHKRCSAWCVYLLVVMLFYYLYVKIRKERGYLFYCFNQNVCTERHICRAEKSNFF